MSMTASTADTEIVSTFFTALLTATLAYSQNDPAGATAKLLTCESQLGGKEYCRAATSSGVALATQTSSESCLLGKTWGYDDQGVWVADGCGAKFVVGNADGASGSRSLCQNSSSVLRLLLMVIHGISNLLHQTGITPLLWTGERIVQLRDRLILAPRVPIINRKLNPSAHLILCRSCATTGSPTQSPRQARRHGRK